MRFLGECGVFFNPLQVTSILSVWLKFDGRDTFVPISYFAAVVARAPVRFTGRLTFGAREGEVVHNKGIPDDLHHPIYLI